MKIEQTLEHFYREYPVLGGSTQIEVDEHLEEKKKGIMN